jgi:flavin reductase (DIM6/NTAB) family NADH-FMN oxidoreductase RutF
MINISGEDISEMNPRFRVQLINSLSGLKPLFLIGSYNRPGENNLAIFNSVSHIGADPPLLSFISRPNTVQRNTLENIIKNKVYSLNAVSEGIYKNAHHTSARYSSNQSEFEFSNLNIEYFEKSHLPFVRESPIKIAMKLREKIDIQSNGTHMIIGEVRNVYLEKDSIEEDGFLSIKDLNLIAGSGLDAYYRAEFIERLPYAKAKL